MQLGGATVQTLEQNEPAPELTILMPCLNEAETLASCIGKARAFLDREGISGEILIADNGSTDGSPRIAEQSGARVVHVSERGYGLALLHGTRAARGTYVIMGDADSSYDFSALGPFVEKLHAGYDVVIGNRFQGGIEDGAMPFLHRYLGNPVLSYLGRLFFAIPIGDFHCGLRAFRRDRLLEVGLRAQGMEFASEMIVRSALNGLSIAEAPTTLSPDGRSRRPHLRTWRDGWRHLRFLLMFSPRWLFLYPGLVLLALGAVAEAALLVGPVSLGHVVLDIHTMLFAGGAMIAGVQMVMFSLIVKTAAAADGLLPSGSNFRRFLDHFTLERGLVLGTAMLIAGLSLAGYSLFLWVSTGLSQLDPRQVMRVVIPSLTFSVIGMEIMFSSFALSFLRWKINGA
ncbi:MAG TPA: glycosyltransferase family 2 protein [Casimicrobiaceae bacterium]|nr:glycosyltransferase family 2 protein [Casimicrobiaceae bacterium]